MKYYLTMHLSETEKFIIMIFFQMLKPLSSFSRSTDVVNTRTPSEHGRFASSIHKATTNESVVLSDFPS